MTTIYISVPMTGRSEEDISADINAAGMLLLKRFGGMDKCQILTPCKIADDVRRMFENHDVPPKYMDYLVWDIHEMVEQCDAVYFCKEWQQSKDCRLEMAAAKIFEKTIIYEQ